MRVRCGRLTLTFVLFVTTPAQADEPWLDRVSGPAFVAVALNVWRRLGARFPGLVVEWR